MQKEILSLTSLRFVAALFVFLFHFNLSLPVPATTSVVGKILSHGADGMSLFFILSGFVLAYRFKDGVNNIQSYAFMRFSRIYPIYILAALLSLPKLISSIEESHATTYLEEIGRYSFLIIANILLLSAWFPQLFPYWNGGGSWSISVEVFFYALFPAIIKPLRKLTDRGLCIALGIFYIGASAPGICYVLFPDPPSIVIFYAIPIFRLFEFLAGMTCGILFARGSRATFPTLTVLASIATLAIYMIYGPDYRMVVGNWAVVPTLIGLIFGCASLTSGPLFQLITIKLFVGLGHISYSMFSLQVVLFLLLKKYQVTLITKIPLLASHYAMCFAAFVVLALVSSVTYYLIEVRLRMYLNSMWHRSRTTPRAKTLGFPVRQGSM